MSKGETQNNSDSTTGHLKRVAYTSFLCPEVVVLVGGSLWDGGRRGSGVRASSWAKLCSS